MAAVRVGAAVDAVLQRVGRLRYSDLKPVKQLYINKLQPQHTGANKLTTVNKLQQNSISSVRFPTFMACLSCTGSNRTRS